LEKTFELMFKKKHSRLRCYEKIMTPHIKTKK